MQKSREITIRMKEKMMSRKYEVTVTVSFNGHRITRTSKVEADSPELAKEMAEAMADVDVVITSGTPRVPKISKEKDD